MPLYSRTARPGRQNELKRFATDLNLSDEQKEKLRTSLSEGYEKVQEYKQQNPKRIKGRLD